MTEKTLRDEFAMAALTGIISTWANPEKERLYFEPGKPDAKRVAASAYFMADAMLAERLKGQAEKQAKEDGSWIPWMGGDPPTDEAVTVRFHNDETDVGLTADFDWDVGTSDWMIKEFKPWVTP